MSIKLGDKVKDKVTGFTGIAISRIEFLNGCTQIQIQPQKLKDGRPIESEYFDIQQIEKIEEPKPKVKKENTGGGYRKYPNK